MNPLYADRATNELRSHPSAASDVAGAGAQDDKAVMAEDDNTQRHPSPPRPRSNSDEKAITMEDKVGEYTAVNPFETDANGEVALHYHKIQGLQDKHLDALTKMDIDGNGTVSLSEMLTMEKSNRSLKQTVCYLAIALLLLIGTLFAISWAAAVLAQNTKVSGDGHTMVAAAHRNEIISTAEAKESVPAAFASLLSPDQLGRVKDITLVKLTQASKSSFMSNTNAENSTGFNDNSTMIFETPKRITAQIQSIQEFNDTYIKFYCMGGITIAIDHGAIQVTGLAQSPETKFMACGSAKCSSIQVNEVDVTVLNRRASQLGFVNTVDGDRITRRNAMRRTGASHGSCSDGNLCQDNTRIWHSDEWWTCMHSKMHGAGSGYCACDTGFQYNYDDEKCKKCPPDPIGKCYNQPYDSANMFFASLDKSLSENKDPYCTYQQEDRKVTWEFKKDKITVHLKWMNHKSCRGYYSRENKIQSCSVTCTKPVQHFEYKTILLNYQFTGYKMSCKYTCSNREVGSNIGDDFVRDLGLYDQVAAITDYVDDTGNPKGGGEPWYQDMHWEIADDHLYLWGTQKRLNAVRLTQTSCSNQNSFILSGDQTVSIYRL